MRLKFTTFALLIALISTTAGAKHYVGGDISLLPEYENAGAIYKDHNGEPIAELLPWLHEQGMNAMRVRLFVNPDDYTGPDRDPNTCQTLEYILPLCKRIKDAGLDLLLDFHYSDTWADPAKQWTPKQWAGLNDEELCQTIYAYTKNVLESLRNAGAAPDLIQPGNEISYGMLWGPYGTPSGDLKKCYSNSNANWDRFGNLLKNAIKACREVCPDAGIIIHTERVSQVSVQNNFYDQMKRLGIDYDIIGLSYYPYFHGGMNVLNTALANQQRRYPEKQIMIVETGYSYKWEVPGTTHDMSSTWSYSDQGQDLFVKDLLKTVEQYDQVDGIFWWWMEYNAFNTSLSGWYNAPLFDSTTGKACSALTTLCSFATSGINGVTADDDAPRQWYDISGRPVDDIKAPGLYISRKAKILVK